MKNIRKIFVLIAVMMMVMCNIVYADGNYFINVKLGIQKFGAVDGKLSLWKISDKGINEEEKQKLIQSLDRLSTEDLNKKYNKSNDKNFKGNEVIFEKLDNGAFYIRDTSGIQRTREISSMIINLPENITDSSNGVVIMAKEKTTVVRVVKIDKDGNPLKGAEFKLFKKNKNELIQIKNKDNSTGVYTSNDNGEIIIKELKKGDYILRETKAPLGYLINNSDTEFTLDNKSVELKVINTKVNSNTGRHDFIKTDDRKMPLEGAVFKVMTKKDDKFLPVKMNNADYIVTSGENGKFSVENLDFGKYYLVEIKAPKGYKLLSEAVEFDILKEDPNSKTTSVIFIKNERNPNIPPNTPPNTPGTPGKPNIPKTGDLKFFVIVTVGVLLYFLGKKLISYEEKVIKR